MKKVLLACCLFHLLIGTPFARDYLIGDGDLLQVSVWGVPELSAEVTVRPDGKITLPAAGDVVASGRSPEQLGQELTKVLANFVKKPIVTVTVGQITNNRIYISGGGVPAQVIDLNRRTTLFKLLCGLGDLQNADLHRAYLLRSGKVVKTGFHDLFVNGDFSQDIELLAEDILFFPTNELNKIYVVGAVQAPKYIFFREGMKVLDAILEAGGFTEYAKENSVIVQRNNKEIKVRLKKLMEGEDMAQNLALSPGDYVIVREGMF